MSTSSDSAGMSPYLITLIIITALAAVAGGIYASGTSDDVGKFIMERFFKAKAKMEEKALEHAGETKAEGFLKDQLKKNPALSNDELNEISGGLGDEAAQQFGKGGFGKSIGKAFD